MFGIVRGCGRCLTAEQKGQWIAHLCGQCRALGMLGGPAAQLATNNDAALLSVLVEAQTDKPMPRVAGRCPLPPFRRKAMIDPASLGIRLAGTVALLSASIKIKDHIDDGDPLLRIGRNRGRLPHWFRRFAKRGEARARSASRIIDFPAEKVLEVAAGQTRREATAGRSMGYYAGPTEQAVGLAFRHTARLAGRPENAAPLESAGRSFGRIVYLLDAYRDLDDDRERGMFNPLASLETGEVSAVVSRTYREAVGNLREYLGASVFPRPGLLYRLIGDTVRRNRPPGTELPAAMAGPKVDEDIEIDGGDVDDIPVGDDKPLLDPGGSSPGGCCEAGCWLCDGEGSCCEGGCGACGGGCDACECGEGAECCCEGAECCDCCECLEGCDC